MEGMRQETTFHHLADEHGFAVCWPQGSLWNWDGSILPYWNANLFLTPADDIGFLTALAESLQSEHGLSTECTFVAGASNGGMMAYTLISERPDVWKGMATAGGVMSAHEQTNGTVGPPRPVLHIHGTADNAMPYYAYPGGGGPWTGGWGVMEMMEFWAEEHGHTTLDSIALPDEFPGDNLTEDVFEWTGGLGGLVHHRVNGGVHEWWGALATPNEVATSEIVWDFFADLCANPMSIEATPFGQASLANAPVYPNPVSAGASVQWPCARGALYEASGRWVGTTTGHAPEAPGLYIIQCTNGQTTRLLVR
jgi:polyhydroxybutyrate depolymerase